TDQTAHLPPERPPPRGRGGRGRRRPHLAPRRHRGTRGERAFRPWRPGPTTLARAGRAVRRGRSAGSRVLVPSPAQCPLLPAPARNWPRVSQTPPDMGGFVPPRPIARSPCAGLNLREGWEVRIGVAPLV